ncbi:hypothetical protein K2173_015491 [Erythroxylum novogranatense]|uniref:DUF4283 domain-containing protein n=1 Tax=Erythroxylum novogranatense TaxID=1862640 RepID=A0AAV8SSZ8_9ROSI|nr:hypothetical protein K2173_015491 [Erythroxylum novogranatense]
MAMESSRRDKVLNREKAKEATYVATEHLPVDLIKKGGFDVLDIGHDYYLVKFDMQDDFARVLGRDLWAISDHYLYVKPWTPGFFIVRATINSTLVWVRFPKVSVQYYDDDLLTTLATGIGRLIKIDRNTMLANRGQFIGQIKNSKKIDKSIKSRRSDPSLSQRNTKSKNTRPIITHERPAMKTSEKTPIINKTRIVSSSTVEPTILDSPNVEMVTIAAEKFRQAFKPLPPSTGQETSSTCLHEVSDQHMLNFRAQPPDPGSQHIMAQDTPILAQVIDDDLCGGHSLDIDVVPKILA